MRYLPEIGDSVAAERKVKSLMFPNLIIGPVVNILDDVCFIHNNPGEPIETWFKLVFSEWNFQFLHKTSES